MTRPPAIECRQYGDTGPLVAVLHGGPGAPGYMAPVARELADLGFRVLEPLQRRSSTVPLTVAQHIADMREVLAHSCPGERPALVGSSWGAMLALAYAATHPDECGPLVLVGCGTFDTSARARFEELRRERTTPELQKAIEEVRKTVAHPDEQLARVAQLITAIYAFDPIPGELEVIACDAVGNQESWEDMLRLQREGVYPAAVTAIRSPVLMIHGSHDPHPGRMIRDGLLPYLPQIEYHEMAECGHYPWQERRAKSGFYAKLASWLREH